MNITFVVLFVFLAAYILNLLYISVFYHRGLAHNSVLLSPRMKRFVIVTGPWVVGLDALSWSCMHRLHHQHADTKADPHSPHFMGVFGLLIGQLVSYKKIIIALIKQKESYISAVSDIDNQVHWLFRNNLWWLPYVVHLIVAVFFIFIFQSPLVGIAYFLGIMSHPIQGWLVNSLAHSKGYRNYNTEDKSVNNLLLAYLVFGEGYQNNHHQSPDSAKFGVRWFELDSGYWFCLLGEKCGLLTINKTKSKSVDASPAETLKETRHDNTNSLVAKGINTSLFIRKRFIYSILLFAFVGALLVGCNQEKLVIENKAKVINWTQVVNKPFNNNHSVMGIIVAEQHSQLSFERAGKVSSIKVKEGLFLERGTIIAQLNNRELLLNHQKQLAIVEQAKALQIAADNNYLRIQRLIHEKLTSVADLDDAHTDYLVASSHLAVTIAELEHIDNELKKLVLLAPFSGIVARKYVEQEESIDVGQPIIQLDNEQDFEVEFWLTQRLIYGVKVGDIVKVNALSVLEKTQNVVAIITEISQPNKINSMALITAKLSNKAIEINNGDTVQVTFSPGTNKANSVIANTSLSIPVTAVNIDANQKHSVFKYNDKTKKLTQVSITKVLFFGDLAFFDGQLTRGDIIASSGVSLLRNGQSVRLRHVNK